MQKDEKNEEARNDHMDDDNDRREHSSVRSLPSLDLATARLQTAAQCSRRFRHFGVASHCTMRANSSGSKLAPPTRAPSMSGSAISSAMLLGFTEPPYWIRAASATAWPCSSATVERIRPHTAWASCGVAVRPVPMAQIGS